MTSPLPIRGDAKLEFHSEDLSERIGSKHRSGPASSSHQTAHALATDLVTQLSAKGLYAENLPRGAQPPPGNMLIIDGQFVDINEGNQLRRTLIGLGSGESNLNTNVQVYQSARTTEPILEFTTTANNGQMPGAAIMGARGWPSAAAPQSLLPPQTSAREA